MTTTRTVSAHSEWQAVLRNDAVHSFIPVLGDEAGREFLAVSFFDANGKFREARIVDLDFRATLNREEARLLPDKHTSELGPVDYGRIELQPFAIERSGTKLALVLRAPNTRTMVGGSNRNR